MRLMAGDVEIIGTGWAFPIKVNARGGLSWSGGLPRIQDSIWIILSTSLGERVMCPAFGAGAHDFVFEPNSTLGRTQLASAVREALVKWEPRIELVSVRVDPSPDVESQVLATIEYRVRTTNELFNMVYPLYLQEGVG
jgi:phage baseplate assembly protein W